LRFDKIVLNSLYSVNAAWAMRAGFEAGDRPGEFDRSVGAYVLRTGPSLMGGWDRSIPSEDKTTWRDPRVAEAYVREALASDPTSATRTPPSMRTPAGFQREAYAMSLGEKLWDAREIRVPTLILRGARDFWSHPEDLTTFEHDLANAPRVTAVTIPDGPHFLMNDRPERGRARFLAEVTRSLAQPAVNWRNPRVIEATRTTELASPECEQGESCVDGVRGWFTDCSRTGRVL
jgi:pimeloyl-ACP methyl ester carboxylesterase